MARYVSRDPIGMQGGMNVYSYVSNAPVMRADPLGLWDTAFANMPGVQERASLGTHIQTMRNPWLASNPPHLLTNNSGPR
ncbi:RHS repeat-associated core domain-containing protein [Pseudomonas sichuanensis]